MWVTIRQLSGATQHGLCTLQSSCPEILGGGRDSLIIGSRYSLPLHHALCAGILTVHRKAMRWLQEAPRIV